MNGGDGMLRFKQVRMVYARMWDVNDFDEGDRCKIVDYQNIKLLTVRLSNYKTIKLSNYEGVWDKLRSHHHLSFTLLSPRYRALSPTAVILVYF